MCHAGWATCDRRPSAFSVDKAKQLLTDAGWVPGADGIRVAQGAKYAKDSTRLRLKYQTASGAVRRHGQFDIIRFSPNPDIADSQLSPRQHSNGAPSR